MITDVFILDALRTPVGRLGGALAGVRPDDLAATVVKAVVGRSPALDPATIDEVYLGDANGAGEDNRNVARMAVLLAGLPVTVPGATVNRLCGSGLEAVSAASRTIAVGDADVVIAGGVESMTRAPWVLPKPSKAYPTGHEQLWNSALGWRMVNVRMPAEWTIALGEGAEVLADKYAISREEQDVFAAGSHQRADAAWRAGAFDREIVPVDGGDLERDECIRADCTPRVVVAAEAGVPGGRHRHRRKLVAHERRRRRPDPRVGGRRVASRLRRRSPASSRGAPPASNLISTASDRSRRRAWRCAGRASAGVT